MIDLIVYNSSLAQIGLIDNYNSLIWAKRYIEIGDCEVVVSATPENINLLKRNYYIGRNDDDMLCRIDIIEIDTNSESGNTLIVTGYDVKKLLDQRIIWGTAVIRGNLEHFIRLLVNKNCCNPSDSKRQFQNPNGGQLLYLGNSAGFTVVASEQASYKNIGEKIRDWCTANQWGYRIITADQKLYFELYQGTDRHDSVVFSPDYENIAETKYIYDQTGRGNAALVAGAGEGARRKKSEMGTATSLQRYEQYIDARDIGETLEWREVVESYPRSGGYFVHRTNTTDYFYTTLDLHIINESHLLWLQENYYGTIVTIDGTKYYRMADAQIATYAGTGDPTADMVCDLSDLVYYTYLFQRGEDDISAFSDVETFEGTVLTNVTFVYKQDYFLGDQVTVKNDYGISATARIVEVVESVDESGYTVEPKFEYIGGN